MEDLQLDTFDVPVAEAGDGIGADDTGFDTFDTPAPVEEAPSKDEVAKEELDESQTGAIDTADKVEKEVKDEAKEAKDEKKPDDKAEKDSDDNGKDEEKSDDDKPEEKAPRKTIRARTEDGQSDVDATSEFKVKVNGKNMYVPVQELINNYSGKTAWDKKFTEVSNEKAEVEANIGKYQEQYEKVDTFITEVVDAAKNGEGDPLDAMRILLDRLGENSLQYEKRLLSHYGNQFSEMEMMDETEVDNYWMRKELAYNNSRQTSLAERQQAEQTQVDSANRISGIREAQRVSEEAYGLATEALSELGYDVTPELAVDYAVTKPFYERAEAAVEPYTDQLDDDEASEFRNELTLTMRSLPHINDEQAFSIVSQKLGYEIEDDEAHISALENKVGKVEEKVVPKDHRVGKKKEEDELESFEDFYDY